MNINFRIQTEINDGAGGRGAIHRVEPWPSVIPVPQVGDTVNGIAGADPLAAVFQVDARTISLDVSEEFVTCTMFWTPGAGDDLGRTIRGLLTDFDGWEREDA